MSAEAIRFQASRGMARRSLEMTYGRDPVMRALGPDRSAAAQATARACWRAAAVKDGGPCLTPCGREIKLTPQQRAVWRTLAAAAPDAAPRAAIYDALWGGRARGGSPESRLVDVIIHDLRRKLITAGATSWIEAVRSVGYRLAVAGEGAP